MYQVHVSPCVCVCVCVRAQIFEHFSSVALNGSATPIFHGLPPPRNASTHEVQNNYQLNENTNLFSVWSWLNILSDLYDYGNHSDFRFWQRDGGGGVEKWVESNGLSRLHSFDIFPWRRLKMMFFADAVATRWHNTSGSGCVLCKSERLCVCVLKNNWFLVRTDGSK